jgi:uncharacterized protein YjiS (DUF1127 family)
MTCRTEMIGAERRLTTPNAVLHTIATWWDAYWNARARRATIMMLHTLDDRTLHDIGIGRGEIEAAAEGRLDRRRGPHR